MTEDEKLEVIAGFQRYLNRPTQWDDVASCELWVHAIEWERSREKWMPIETAPKDGTMILVCLPRMGNLIVRSRYDRIHGYWVNDYEGEGGVKRGSVYHPGDLWTHMPPAPKETQVSDKEKP